MQYQHLKIEVSIWVTPGLLLGNSCAGSHVLWSGGTVTGFKPFMYQQRPLAENNVKSTDLLDP